MFLHTCKPQYETILSRELQLYGLAVREAGLGWVGSSGNDRPELDLCFAIASVADAEQVEAASVNALAAKLCERFWECHRGEKIVDPWPLLFEAVAEEGVAGRMRTVKSAFLQQLSGRMSRVAKLADESLPPQGLPVRGFYALALAYERFLAGGRLRHWGQRRVRDDALAPSRSYLKVEEAYGILGREPAAGDQVFDLGAAPGGWSYSAARRGAQVVAVDNGPLKGGAKDHPGILHRREDAFAFRPEAGSRGGRRWLYCDMIENPYLVVEKILLPWLERGWCDSFVVNFKVGMMDPVELLRKLRHEPGSELAARCSALRFRQLFHDREEITCVGDIRR